MESLWLLKGSDQAPGWGPLEADARAGKTKVLLFDRIAWALVRAAEAPVYEGLVPEPPPTGLYLDPQGRGIYIAGHREVASAAEVVAVLGEPARELLRTLDDPDRVLERMGRVY